MIQKQTNRLAARRRTGQQPQRHLPVIELNAISGLKMDGSLQAAEAMTQVTGVALVAIHNGYAHPLRIRQGLVALESIVNVVNALSQFAGIHQGMDPSDGVGAAGGLTQPTLPEVGTGGLFQGVEASHPGTNRRRPLLEGLAGS